MVDIFQFLIDNRSTLSPAIVNSAIHETAQIWFDAQQDRYKAFMGESKTQDSRKYRMQGVQKAWRHFLGKYPTKSENGGQPFLGVMVATRKWVLRCAQSPGSFIHRKSGS
jgi:hypothetical protein